MQGYVSDESAEIIPNYDSNEKKGIMRALNV